MNINRIDGDARKCLGEQWQCPNSPVWFADIPIWPYVVYACAEHKHLLLNAGLADYAERILEARVHA